MGPGRAAELHRLSVHAGRRLRLAVPDGVVLWTRLAPEPLGGGGAGPDAIVVRWELADDEGFGRIVQSGSVDAVPAWGHSVHVAVTGLRRPTGTSTASWRATR